MANKSEVVLRLCFAFIISAVVIGMCLNLTKNSTNQFVWRTHFFTRDILRRTDAATREFRNKHRKLPRSLEQLTSDSDFARLRHNGRIIDSWYQPIVYKIEGTDFILLSYGRDKKPGGIGLDCDISNKNPNPAAAKISLKEAFTYKPMRGMLWSSFISGGLVFLLVFSLITPPFFEKKKWGELTFTLLFTLIGTSLVAIIITMLHVPSGH